MMNNIVWIINFLSFLNYHFYFCIEYTPFSIITNGNSQLSVSCFSPNASLTIKWFRYNSNFGIKELQNNSFHKIIPNGILNIVNFQDTNAYYQCASINENNVITFEKIFQVVIISSKLNCNLTKSERILKLSEPYIFNTELIPEKNSKIMWIMWKNNRFYNISLSNDIIQFDNSLKVMSLSPNNDLSFLPCLIQANSNKIITCDKPHFIRSSKLEEKLKLLYAALNDDVFLRCSDNIDEQKYVWYKNGRLLHFGERFTNYGNVISIRNISTDDYGYYQCYINKPFILPYKLSIFLINFYNSSDLFHSFVKKNDQKSSLILPCKNQSTGISSHLFLDFNKISSFSQFKDLINPFSNINFYMHRLSIETTELYQCLVFINNKLHIFSYYFLNKHQKNKKIVINNQNNNNNNNNNNQIILRKRSVNEPSLISDLKLIATSKSIKITWTQPSIQVKTYTINWGNVYPGPNKQIISGKETKFVIESLNPDTQYYIKIDPDTINGAGKSIVQVCMTKKENKEITLTIPVNLKLHDVGDTTARISWDYRENGDTVNKTFFQVEYYSIRHQSGNRHHINTSSTSVNIKDISPATTYEIIVRNCLVNSTKCSDWSMVLEFTTLETKPSDPPQHLTLSTVQLKNIPSDNTLTKNRFAIQVSWQPPKKPNGEIKNYLILVTADKKLDTDNWGERTVSGKSLNTVIDRLDLNRYYYFRIGCSNDYGKSPFSPIRIFKTPDENGKNGGPIILSKDYYDPLEIDEELKLQTSNERGNDNLIDANTNNNNETKNKNPSKLVLTNYKWWIIISIVVGAILVFILIILFLVATKCRNDNIPYENGVKVLKAKNMCDMDYRKPGQDIKFVSKVPILTTPDLFRHTNDQNCHQNYMEMEERTDSPNSFSSNKGFPSQSHNPAFTNQQNYRSIPGHYTPPGLIHQQNMVMTTSQLTSNSNERQFYQVPFLHHIGHNPLNVFTTSAPRVNAAASDFNSINIPSPISGYSDFTSSQATVLYDTSTAKSSGGKSSLSGSGSYNNGLANKAPLVNEPISEGFNSSDKNSEIKNSKSSDAQNLISKAFSSEELSQEMANLEGLMKDLNSITQKEFEC